MNVIVVGGGRVGYYLAATLLGHDHHGTLIENNSATCHEVADALDIPVIRGDGTSVDALREADAGRADVLVAVTGRDEDNLIACQTARIRFKIPKTVAKVNDPKNVLAFQRLGIDIAISGTDYIVRLLEREVEFSQIRQLASLNKGKASISEIKLPMNFALSGKPLSQIPLPEDSVIVSVQRADAILIPRGSTRIYAGDTILVMAKDHVFHQVAEVLGLNID